MLYWAEIIKTSNTRDKLNVTRPDLLAGDCQLHKIVWQISEFHQLWGSHVMDPIIRAITEKQLIADSNQFKVEDGVRMHIFSGIVIARKHAGISEAFTVHRI